MYFISNIIVQQEFDRDIAISVIPENHPDSSSSSIENAAICVQKHFRGYLGRKQYRKKLLEQYEKVKMRVKNYVSF